MGVLGGTTGFRFPGWIGRQYRAWALREVRSSGVPVWGIGEWAIDGYRSELGKGHCFYNVPYFSKLTHSLKLRGSLSREQRCRFLFSGSFIRRKGIDLLFSAFGRLIADGIDAELHLLGFGPLESTLKARYSHFLDRIRLHGFKQWNELASVYAQADVLCAPS